MTDQAQRPDPEADLREVFERIADHPISKLDRIFATCSDTAFIKEQFREPYNRSPCENPEILATRDTL